MGCVGLASGGHCACGRQRGSRAPAGRSPVGTAGVGGRCDGQRGESVGVPGGAPWQSDGWGRRRREQVGPRNLPFTALYFVPSNLKLRRPRNYIHTLKQASSLRTHSHGLATRQAALRALRRAERSLFRVFRPPCRLNKLRWSALVAGRPSERPRARRRRRPEPSLLRRWRNSSSAEAGTPRGLGGSFVPCYLAKGDPFASPRRVACAAREIGAAPAGWRSLVPGRGMWHVACMWRARVCRFEQGVIRVSVLAHRRAHRRAHRLGQGIL